MMNTDFHLALDAVVAYVDHELTPGARTRADAHLAECGQCRWDVDVQQRGKTRLTAAAGPAMPPGLLARLQEIPFTVEVHPPGLELAAHGEDMLWSRTAQEPRAMPVPTAPPASPMRPQLPEQHRPPGRPAAVTAPRGRRERPGSLRMRRLRRGLLGAVAGLAVGVLATATAPVAVSGTGTATSVVPARPGTPETASALFGTLDEQIAPRQFSGAAVGLR